MTRDEAKPMDREAVIELMARGIDPRAWMPEPPTAWVMLQERGISSVEAGARWWASNEAQREQSLRRAKRALLSIEDAGQAVTPREPTREQRAAASRINHARDEEIYRAMHDARPSRPVEEG